METKPKLSIIVPCYNEADGLRDLLAAYAKVITRDDIEVIVVDNASEDNTEAILNELLPTYQNFLRVVRTTEKGYGLAIVSGLAVAQGEFIGWTHGDLQAPPDDVLRALEIIEQRDNPKNIYVKGLRSGRPLFDTFFTVGMSMFEGLYLKQRLWDINAQPNIFHRDFFATWQNPPHDFSLDLFALYLARKRKLNIVRFPVFFLPRTHGTSSWNTGLLSRWKFIKRTLSFSVLLKKRLK
jgi:glycosyltransferase involved in cell wall biosynthesis